VKLNFLGANRQVTGSRYALETNHTRLMVDCGLFQEREFQSRNWHPSPLPPGEVDALLLTHAHIDHCGLLPRFVKQGYRHPIITTQATADLLEVMLRDAADIQLEDAAYKRRRHRREDRPEKYAEQALFDQRDVDHTLPLVQGVDYHVPRRINAHATVTFHDAGHILGSAMLELTVDAASGPRRIIFSGDIGQWNKPLLRDPVLLDQADYVVMESTYGDRDHTDGGNIEDQLADILGPILRDGGKVVVPTFAVERAQELMFYLSRLVRQDRIPDVKIFLDSPMAVDVTQIFQAHRDCFDAEAQQRMAGGDSPLVFPGLTLVRTVEQSKAINAHAGPAIIMATSGMCTAGRIKHHLRQNIEDPRSAVIFVGYQSHGTLGRQILDRNPQVRIHGRNYRVRAQVRKIYGFSGHADRTGLLRWAGHFQQPPRQMFLTHGEEETSLKLADEIRRAHGWPVTVPHYLSQADLD